MPGTRSTVPYICARCLQVSKQRYAFPIGTRTAKRPFSQRSPPRGDKAKDKVKDDEEDPNGPGNDSTQEVSSKNAKAEPGAMSRRLAEATEEALFEGGRAGRKAVEDAGFSDQLKEELLEKIKAANFKADNMSAFTEASLPSNVGRGSRDIATAQSWTGTEATEDTVLRMLSDARKPLNPSLRGIARIPGVAVDLRLKREPKLRPGERLANARDKTSIYAISKDVQMTDKEREDMRRELKERFTPAARAMPNSMRGLAALANERIEDAIARGQFKNIPRGKAIERDTRADNPFLDTTEYIMNKMIQRQDIVPPWIEKQQELVKAANVFRSRLRNDWKRHAARTIASWGGSLQEQMQAADRYAEAERIRNPKRRAVDQISIPTNATSDPVMVSIAQEVLSSTSSTVPPVQVSIETKDSEITMLEPSPSSSELASPESPPHTQAKSLPLPFRLPEWEATEKSYLTLAITNLNSLARSYNLMAPDLAKKPYFTLERELKSCYADVAPQLANEIKERAARPSKEFVEKIGHKEGGLLARFSGGESVVYDSKRPLYGFKDFWRDLWGEKGKV